VLDYTWAGPAISYGLRWSWALGKEYYADQGGGIENIMIATGPY
jgi:hypothetical protein